MTPTMEHTLYPIRQRQPGVQDLRHVTKITACGGMIGTGILFPVANIEGLWFRAVTLSIFILATLGFHALHMKPFVRFGLFTAAVALILLLVAVLSAGSTRRELIPWLPLFIASLSLVTVAIYEIFQHARTRPLSITAEDSLSGVSIDTWSERSLRTWSGPREPQVPAESNRFDPLLWSLHGPSSRCSHRTDTDATELSLSSVVGQFREDWDAHTRSHFRDDISPEPNSHREAHPGDGQSQETVADRNSDLGSEHGTEELSRPLLGPQ